MGKKEAYFEKCELRLKELDADIAKLKTKASIAKADAKIKCSKTMDALRTKRATVATQLMAVRSASGEALKDVKASAKSAWEELKHAVTAAISEFK